MSFSFDSSVQGFGLDLSDRSVKIAQFDQRRRKLNLLFIKTIDLPEGLVVDGEILEVNKLTETITQALAPYQKKLARGAAIALPEAKTFIQTILVPKKEKKSLSELLPETLPEYLPLPLSEVYYDTVTIEEVANGWRVLVGAAPKTIVNLYLTLIEKLNIIPLAFDLTATAITRTIIPIKGEKNKHRAIIDLGRKRSSIIVHDGSTIQLTVSLPISGEAITAEIAKSLSLTIEQAEKAKCTCGLDPQKCEGVLKKILDAMVANLVKHIEEARIYYQDRFSGAADFSEIILTGGGAHLVGLDTVLSNTLKLPVRLGNLWENVTLDNKTDINTPLQFAVVIGLASRGLNENNSNL